MFQLSHWIVVASAFGFGFATSLGGNFFLLRQLLTPHLQGWKVWASLVTFFFVFAWCPSNPKQKKKMTNVGTKKYKQDGVLITHILGWMFFLFWFPHKVLKFFIFGYWFPHKVFWFQVYTQAFLGFGFKFKVFKVSFLGYGF
jgi:hypothetical protein